jgi:hypothetical protein
MNAGFRSPLFILGLSVAVLVPPPIPTKIIQRAGSYATRDQLEYELWVQRIIDQNADDLEVVRILTEFLSRIS